MIFFNQLGDGLGEEVVVPTNGGSGGRRGAEVEVSQCLAVRERPQEQLLREFLLRGGGKEEEEEEGQEEDRSSAGADPPIWRGPRRREPPFPHGRMPSAMCGHGRR